MFTFVRAHDKVFVQTGNYVATSMFRKHFDKFRGMKEDVILWKTVLKTTQGNFPLLIYKIYRVSTIRSNTCLYSALGLLGCKISFALYNDTYFRRICQFSLKFLYQDGGYSHVKFLNIPIQIALNRDYY